MRVLYIYSDWKWTGPSQPIVELCDYMSKHADVITTFSKKIREILSPKFGNVVHINTWLDMKAIVQTPHNVSVPNEFMIDNKSFIIGLVMRLQPYRRFDLVMETAKCIKASGKNSKFLILGRGKAGIVKNPLKSLVCRIRLYLVVTERRITGILLIALM